MLFITVTPEKSKQSLNNLGSIEKEKPVANTIFGGKGNIFAGQGLGGQNVFNGGSPLATSNTSGSLFGPSSFLATTTKEPTSKENENVSEEENEKAEKTIFGGSGGSSGFKFGESQPLFGSAIKFNKPEENSNAPIFGSKMTTTFSFAEAAKDIDSKAVDATETPKYSFGNMQPKANSNPPKALFGFNTTSSDKEKQSSQSFLMEEKKQETNERIFGSTQPIFGSFSTAASTVDPNKKTESFFPTSTETPSFGSLKANISSETSSVDLSKDILKTDPGLSFASLASASAQSNAFQNTNAPAGGGFYGISNNQQDFSHFFKNAANDSASRDDSNANDTSTTEETPYDPHYEPIIALPDEIVVTTGEENEEKLFGERTKLFRYDENAKEWKERGEQKLCVNG